MITSNAGQIAKELQQYADEVERKLKAMVAGFVVDATNEAGGETKVIKESTLQTQKWQEIYQDRKRKFGISVEPGYHSGAWQYSEGDLVFDPKIRDEAERFRKVRSDVESEYRLGDTFVFGLIGPAATYAAPSTIVLEAMIMSAFLSDVKRHFDNG